jgi:hypothetical protein
MTSEDQSKAWRSLSAEVALSQWLAEKGASLARTAEKRKVLNAKHARRKAERDKKKASVNSVEGVRYFHYRSIYNPMRDGHGGVCVVMREVDGVYTFAASICSRDEMYDKLQAREYALERLIHDDPNGRIAKVSVTLTCGRMQYRPFVEKMARMTAQNAVACLGRRADRDWFISNIF